MKKYRLNMIITVSVLLLILLLVFIRNNISDASAKKTMNSINLCLGIIFLIYIVLSCFYIMYSIKKDNKEAFKNIKEKKFEELEELSMKQIKKYFFLRQILNSKYNLLISYFALGKHDKAFTLLNETRWGYYNRYALTYKVFELLYDKNVEDARSLYQKLCRINKNQDDNLDIIGFIFDFIDNNIKNDKLQRTIYPIVNLICEKYEK